MKLDKIGFYNNYNNKTKNHRSPSYKGHLGIEPFANNSLKRLVHETGFFREAGTDEFLKNFILNRWKNKPQINIICGACSTGEEAITLSMILDKIKDKVSILGTDISETCIDEAKSRIYKFSYDPRVLYSANKDYFLFSQEYKPELSDKEREYKSLFRDFFEDIEYNTIDSIDLAHLLNKSNHTTYQYLPSREGRQEISGRVKLKDNKAKNCEFKQNDIMNIDLITQYKKANIITFRNALYHLITEDVDGYRCIKKDAHFILDDLLRKFRDSLVADGLLVFGTREEKQILDKSILTNTLQINRFRPLNGTYDKATVWQKMDLNDV